MTTLHFVFSFFFSPWCITTPRGRFSLLSYLRFLGIWFTRSVSTYFWNLSKLLSSWLSGTETKAYDVFHFPNPFFIESAESCIDRLLQLQILL
jgi:hypothetical protein